MDLLAQYTDSDDDSRSSSPEPQPPAEPEVAPTILLPPPDLSSLPTVPTVASTAPVVKRAHIQTSGTGPLQGPTKLAKTGPAPKPATTATQLLPPQLRGRSNVVTEDLEKMFGKKVDAATRKRPAGADLRSASSTEQGQHSNGQAKGKPGT